MWTWLSRLAVLGAGLGLIATVAAYALRPAVVPADWSRMDDRDRDIGTVPLGPHEVAFQIANVSDRPGRVIGVGEGCARSVCYKPKFTDPIVVQPGGTAEFACELMVSRPGPFEVSMTLYLEDNGIHGVKLTVRGVGATPEGKTHDPPARP